MLICEISLICVQLRLSNFNSSDFSLHLRLFRLNQNKIVINKATEPPISLNQISTGTNCRLVNFNDHRLAGKLMSMGVLPGNTIRIVQKLWFGSNLFISCNDQRIALRKEEAAMILVKRLSEDEDLR